MTTLFILRDLIALASVVAFAVAALIWGEHICNAAGGL